MARVWLLKSEPSVFSFEDLRNAPRKTTCWDGVRNFQARNLLRDELKKGDRVLFYHSSASPPAIAGLAGVAREGYPDPTQFDPRSSHHDPGSDPSEPRWYAVDIQYVKPFKQPVTLPQMRDTKALAGMLLLRRGMRLSVQPVQAKEYQVILKMGGL